jgi:hypothetical protein
MYYCLQEFQIKIIIMGNLKGVMHRLSACMVIKVMSRRRILLLDPSCGGNYYAKDNLKVMYFCVRKPHQSLVLNHMHVATSVLKPI